jgi:hypothetical protein
MSAKGTTGIGNIIPVGDFRNCVVKIGTASSANMTIKAQGAVSSINAEYTPPAFGSSPSVSNNWDYVQMVDLNDGTPYSGDTGMVLTGTDDFRLFEININGLDFISFVITAVSAGTATIDVQLSTNL